jgi:hypothetical protein
MKCYFHGKYRCVRAVLMLRLGYYIVLYDIGILIVVIRIL